MRIQREDTLSIVKYPSNFSTNETIFHIHWNFGFGLWNIITLLERSLQLEIKGTIQLLIGFRGKCQLLLHNCSVMTKMFWIWNGSINKIIITCRCDHVAIVTDLSRGTDGPEGKNYACIFTRRSELIFRQAM